LDNFEKKITKILDTDFFLNKARSGTGLTKKFWIYKSCRTLVISKKGNFFTEKLLFWESIFWEKIFVDTSWCKSFPAFFKSAQN
jgi:hypothetical protein